MKEYEHVLKLWNKFEMKNKNDVGLSRFGFKTFIYDISNKIYDILLLADVLEKFRNKSLKNYGLCPSHYLHQP